MSVGQSTLAYRDQLVRVVTAAALEVDAVIVYGDGRTPWPWLWLTGPGWGSFVTVVPTSDGIVLEVVPDDGSTPRALPTWGRSPGAVVLELVTLAAPHLTR